MARVCGRGIERGSADGIERESAMGSSESLRPRLRSSGSLRRGSIHNEGRAGVCDTGGPAGPIVFLVFLLGKKDTWGNK